MKTVVAKITPEEHSLLRKRAKAARRSIGAQLAAEAFGKLGMDTPACLAPAPLSAPAATKKARNGKGVAK